MISGSVTLKMQDRRLCRIYFQYLSHRNIFVPNVDFYDTKNCCKIINELLQYHYPEIELRQEFIRDMELECAGKIIPNDDFAWLHTSERACYWLWGYIRSADFNMLGSNLPSSYFIDQTRSLSTNQTNNTEYENLGLNIHPVNTTQRFNYIIDFFDVWNADISHKSQFLKRVEKDWQEIYKYPAPFKWLDFDDKEQCGWVWEYIVDFQKKKETIVLYSERMKVPAEYLTPLNENEKKLAIYGAIDLWRAPPDTKTLFFKNINKAWSQKKHRLKRTGSKPFNTYLKTETKDKLDELVRYHDKKIIDILDQLINQAFDNLPPH